MLLKVLKLYSLHHNVGNGNGLACFYGNVFYVGRMLDDTD